MFDHQCLIPSNIHLASKCLLELKTQRRLESCIHHVTTQTVVDFEKARTSKKSARDWPDNHVWMDQSNFSVLLGVLNVVALLLSNPQIWLVANQKLHNLCCWVPASSSCFECAKNPHRHRKKGFQLPWFHTTPDQWRKPTNHLKLANQDANTSNKKCLQQITWS